MPLDREHCAQRLREHRERLGLTQAALASELATLGAKLHGIPGGATERLVRAWELGEKRPGPRYQELLCTLYDATPAQLGFRSPEPSREEDETFEVMEMVRRAERTDIGAGTLEGLHAAVHRLCCDYPSVPAAGLRDETERHLGYVLRLLDGRATLAQHRELLVIASWLSALLGCLQMDLGNRRAAEAGRDAAHHLGQEAGELPVVRWSHEMRAWFALTDGRYRDVTIYSRAGLDIGGEDSAAVQLALQEAKGWARLGDRQQAEAAIQRGAAILERLPVPEHPEHHFVFDPTKYAFYAAPVYQWLGDDTRAEEHAHEVFAQCVGPDGTTTSPMRLAEMQVVLGLVAIRHGDLDTAAEHGMRALAYDRKSGPSLLGRAGELDTALRRRFSHERATAEFHDRYALACREFGFTPPALA